MNKVDYIYPNFIAKILRKPSQRTQYESTLVGLTGFIITSLATSIYVVFFTDLAFFWRLFTGLGEIFIFMMMFSSLSTTFVQYYTFKKAMGLYPPDKELQQKIDEAEALISEMNKLKEELKDVV